MEIRRIARSHAAAERTIAIEMNPEDLDRGPTLRLIRQSPRMRVIILAAPDDFELAEEIRESLAGEALHATDELLTGRERRILQLMADGLTKKEIATRAEISVHTVSTHIRSIYDKLQVSTNTGAVAKALRAHLI